MIKILKDYVLIAMLLIIITINTTDFIKDIYSGDDWMHVGLEVLTVTLAIWGIFMIIGMIRNRSKELSRLHQQVESTQNDLELLQTKFKEVGREYSKYIREQFDLWGLTASEKEVSLLLLKGLSFKEIAELRNTKEKTVRHQASAIYSKSNVAGRYEFSAWFFEDLLI